MALLPIHLNNSIICIILAFFNLFKNPSPTSLFQREGSCGKGLPLEKGGQGGFINSFFKIK
jgi:hypothetical protein